MSNRSTIRREDALLYHSSHRRGKIEVVPTKSVATQRDLSLAYSPGVAEPCREIAANVEEVYKYTAKGNLVAVISNGTAVLGLGNIGPEAAKPVMEGKGVLFKKFADIDVFDIEVNAPDVETFVKVVKALEPTFGGINLEDIKSPECFEIERRLKAELSIPVMHDDQHGTAIISAAALINALELVNKKIEDITIVVSGAGAASIACLNLYCRLGLDPRKVLLFDSKGLIHKNRPDVKEFQKIYATDRTDIVTLADALKGADMFLGLSVGNLLTPDMIRSMAKNPIVFAMANPDPEIPYPDAVAARDDVIVATGRSDYPNQVNNVLGFPYIFRGALDVRATEINEEMKLAAAKALASLAHQPVPEIVIEAYGGKNIVFGKEYLIPKPNDPRLITEISMAVAKAAMETGVARNPIQDWDKYREELLGRLGMSNNLIRMIGERAKKAPKRVVFAEADTYKILKAAQIVKDEGIATPILLGNVDAIKSKIEEYELDLGDVEMIDPRREYAKLEEFAEVFWRKRCRKGISRIDAYKLMRERNYYGAMLVELGYADSMVSGLTTNYPRTITPAIEVIGLAEGVNYLAGMHIIQTKKETYFFADTTINRDEVLSVEQLVEITRLTAEAVQSLGIKPRIALLSFSNFGSNRKSPVVRRVIQAVEILKKRYPNWLIDGELQANFALRPDLLQERFPFSELAQEGANVLIFPDLASGNIGYKLVQELANASVIGPILLGLKKPVHILQLGSSVDEIVNMVTYAVMDCQKRQVDNPSLQKV
ncbi:MAG: NADP-dependent malic enzyme [Bacteroidia bacterium]|nr:NADP-dependent malic enzyme [Bacteroidia bacterium]MDW8301849.1 NADP-dependent malic enzyme [Bacteroidia bacterium]